MSLKYVSKVIECVWESCEIFGSFLIRIEIAYRLAMAINVVVGLCFSVVGDDIGHMVSLEIIFPDVDVRLHMGACGLS